MLVKLSHVRALTSQGAGTATQRRSAPDPKQLVGQLLTCVYQSTRNSGPETLAAAKCVADITGAEFFEWNVDAVVDQYVDTRLARG